MQALNNEKNLFSNVIFCFSGGYSEFSSWDIPHQCAFSDNWAAADVCSDFNYMGNKKT